ncbi:hypothetical protein EJ06DRAFT_315811 [Trichodelitschia bisporula]|uniref:Uncharacterized protein n=1 Tax=Trichodelitschia bisporula TaxID=703511 RepID=A0A6G1I3T4_9PEZI|nr:hypothetical protein EJ06DRAFT_315811 [Trichodelitschia bisporula]
MSSPRTSTTSSPTLSQRFAAHHASTQAAYEAYYGAGLRSGTMTPRSTSSSSTSSASSTKAVDATAALPQTKDSSARKAWTALKQRAAEHHRSVNAAYGVYYGAGTRFGEERRGSHGSVTYRG